MTNKEWKRHMAYEALVILGMLALLLYVCRLWPILLLVILGIFGGGSAPGVPQFPQGAAHPAGATGIRVSRASAGRDKTGSRR